MENENTQMALRDVSGPLEDFSKKLLSEEGGQWLSAFKKFLRKENPWEKPLFKNDKAKDGWKLLEDIPFDGKQFVPEFVEFLKSGESCVNGEEMKRRAQKLNVHLGQRHAEYLLEHQESIPKELRGKNLVFPGTVWLGSDDDRFVPYLRWLGGRWYLSFRWLSRGWDVSALLVGSRE